MTMYRDMVGVRMDRRDPNVIKTFSKEVWSGIQEFLMEKHDEVEGVFNDDDGEGVEEELGESNTPLTSSISDNEVAVPTVVSSLPAMSGTVPKMTEDDKEEIEENGKENNEGDGKKETSP